MKCKIDCEKTGKEVCPANTHWSACGTVRIKVAYGKVPLRARWERMLCKEREPFRKGAPSISLRVFCGSGCVKSRKFRENIEKHYLIADAHAAGPRFLGLWFVGLWACGLWFVGLVFCLLAGLWFMCFFERSFKNWCLNSTQNVA